MVFHDLHLYTHTDFFILFFMMEDGFLIELLLFFMKQGYK